MRRYRRFRRPCFVGRTRPPPLCRWTTAVQPAAILPHHASGGKRFFSSPVPQSDPASHRGDDSALATRAARFLAIHGIAIPGRSDRNPGATRTGGASNGFFRRRRQRPFQPPAACTPKKLGNRKCDSGPGRSKPTTSGTGKTNQPSFQRSPGLTTNDQGNRAAARYL